MNRFELFYAPTACSDVTLIALEHLAVPYELRLVRFAKGEHRQPDYMKLNPKRKVPLLLVSGQPMTETPAILTYLAKTRPDAGLLPFGEDELVNARVISDLAWVASGLHPLVTRIFLPSKICDLPESTDRIREMAIEEMKSNLNLIESQLGDRDWIYGDWSALDGYIFWVHNRLQVSGFDLSEFPRFSAHGIRMMQVPAVQRAWAQRSAMQEQLKSEGLLPPTPAVSRA